VTRPVRDARPTPLVFGVFLAALIAVTWPEILLGTHSFIARDYGFFGYPLAHYHRESFWRGEMPFWNPLNNCGIPFLAQWNTMTLYPGSLLYLLLPLPWSLGMFCLLHLFWGGLGMSLLARRWTGHPLGSALAGIAFAFNGVLLNSLMWPNNLAALGWMPWVVLAVERSWLPGRWSLGVAGVLGAMQMLTGGPEIILLTWGFVGLLAFIGRGVSPAGCGRRLGRLGAVVLLVGLLSAVQLLPFLDLLRQSQRDEHFYESAWAMPGSGWANFVAPLFGCLKTAQGRFFQWDQYWTSSYYAGIAVLVLALLAAWQVRRRDVRFLAGIAVAGWLLALGDAGHLFPLLKQVVPQVGFMRYPIKVVVWVSFALPLLAAFGLRWLLGSTSCAPAQRARAATLLAAGLTCLGLGLIGFDLLYPQPQRGAGETVLNGLSRGVLLWAGLGLGLALRRARSALIGLLLLAAVAADLLTAVPLMSPTAPRAVLRSDLTPWTHRPAFGASRAMVTFTAHQRFNTFSSANVADDFLVKRAALFANANLIDGIPKLDGFYSLYLNHSDAIVSALYHQTNHAEIAAILASTNRISFAGLYTFLGVDRLSSEGTFLEWTYRTNFMPLFSAGQTPIRTNDAATLAGLLRPDFNPRQWVYLTAEAEWGAGTASKAAARVQAERLGANLLSARVQAAEPGLVVVAQSFHRNWQAFLDRRPVPLLRANHAFQAVPVVAGDHVLTLHYVDPGFIAGLLVSGLTLSILAFRAFSGGPLVEPALANDAIGNGDPTRPRVCQPAPAPVGLGLAAGTVWIDPTATG
jgi:hypothetical protein